MRIAQEETFGPVLGLTVFDTEDEALAHGQLDPVRTGRLRPHPRPRRASSGSPRVWSTASSGMNTGMISAANVPFGGVKHSGYGREGGRFGIDEYLVTKYVAVAI